MATPAPEPVLPVTGNPEADQLLVDDPFARLLGMLLDQQVPMEWAFGSPLVLKGRMGGRLDPATLAALPLEDVEALFKGPPALHRYPGSMAKRAHQLCQVIVDEYGGDTAAIWTGVTSGNELFGRLRALPGFGGEKSKIFLALLAKRFGVAPEGWQELAGPFGDATPRSVADIDSAEALLKVREFKKANKAAGKAKDDSAI